MSPSGRRGTRISPKGNLNSTQAKQGAGNSLHRYTKSEPGKMGSNPTVGLVLNGHLKFLLHNWLETAMLETKEKWRQA